MAWITLNIGSRIGHRKREPRILPLQYRENSLRPLSMPPTPRQTVIVDPPTNGYSRPISQLPLPHVRVISPKERESNITYIQPASSRRFSSREPLIYHSYIEEESGDYDPHSWAMETVALIEPCLSVESRQPINQEIIVDPVMRRPRSRLRSSVYSSTRNPSTSTATPSLSQSASSRSSSASSSPASLSLTPKISSNFPPSSPHSSPQSKPTDQRTRRLSRYVLHYPIREIFS